MENFIEIQPGIVFHYEARKSKRHPRIETQTQLFKYVSRCERTSAYLSHERDFFFNSAYTVHVKLLSCSPFQMDKVKMDLTNRVQNIK